ncbi:MAG: hypothetical protein N2039_15525, partial [Gemmataceae bacterium]|nr:hypothetical protein [Gemmataceae bacterium]
RRSTALAESGETNLRQIPVPIIPGPQVEQEGPPAIVQLRPGVNSFSFRQPPLEDARSHTFEARFIPLGVIDAQGQFSPGLPGDRAENNRAQTHVLAQGQRRILFIESAGQAGQHRLLMALLARAGRSRFQTFSLTTADLPANRAELAVLLSNFDAVVLANVPAEQLSAEQMEVIRSNTGDQGCGLVMIGGPDSFGAGGWQGTPVEAALPVDCDVRNLRVAGKGGLVLIFHASEFDVNNRLQKETAKLAVRKLSPIDMLGVIYWDVGTDWYVRFQTVGDNKADILRRIEKMTPNDMPDCNPALQMALEELTKPIHQLATRHIIFISDGDHWTADAALLQRMKEANVTCTTVCVTSHGANEIAKMKALAESTGARSYLVTDGRQLPAIYIQETRVVSQSFVDERRFVPVLRLAEGPAAGLSAPLPALHGFNRTSKKPSPLALMPIEGPSIAEQEYPVLAYWHYGVGRAVAFTSDARTQLAGFQGWDREWAASEMYLKFWEQVFSWVVRGVESGRLVANTEYRDGKIHVSVDARDANGKPLTNLRLEAAITPPNPATTEGKNLRVPLQQKGPGLYEAEFAADDAGSYFLNITAKETVTEVQNGKTTISERTVDSVRAGLTIPYSPEFRDVEANPALMRQLAEITGGNVYPEDDTELRRVAESGLLYRPTPTIDQPEQPVWPWFVFFAVLALLLDVAVRRIEFDVREIVGQLDSWWRSRRRGSTTGADNSMLEQLSRRPPAPENSVDRDRAARRFPEAEGEQNNDRNTGRGPPA